MTGGRTVRACVETVKFVHSVWISLLGGIVSGRRIPRVCLRIGRPLKTPLNDGDVKIRERNLNYCLLLGQNVNNIR